MSDDIEGVEIIDDQTATDPPAKPAKGEPISHQDLEQLLAKSRKREEQAEARARSAEADAERSRREATETGRRAESAEEARYNSEVTAVSAALAATNAEIERAEEALAVAQEAGNYRDAARANREMVVAAAKLTRIEERKAWLDTNKTQILEASRPRQQTQQQDDLARILGHDPSAGERAWVRDNPEFLTDNEFRSAIAQYHQEAVRKKIPVDSARYYEYIDGRKAEEFGQDGDQDGQENEVETPAPQRRTAQRPAQQMPVQRRGAPGNGGTAGNGAISLTRDEKEAADIALGHLPIQDYVDTQDGREIKMPGRYRAYAMGRERRNGSGGG